MDQQNAVLGSFLFADGSQKVLAGFIVWLSLLMVWPSQSDLAKNPQVVQLVASLLEIKVIYKASESATNSLDAMLARIIKQNSDSRVQPVSSLQWCSILMSIRDSTGQDISLDEALAKYNDHPEVMMRATADAGSGTIALDNKRKYAVRNLFHRTAAEAFEVLEASCHDVAWSMGPYGETFLSFPTLFLQSTVQGFCGVDSASFQPLDNEPYIHVDWNLPMTALAQKTLFKRVKALFYRQTATVPVQAKKKYRIGEEALKALRNMICLWSQLQPHLETRLSPPEAAKWEEDMSSGSSRDEDIKYILEMLPERLSLSMLPSSKTIAQEQAVEREQRICLEVEKQRMDVVEAQWKFFQSALQRDQAQIESIKEAPKKIANKLHQKRVQHMATQAKAGEARPKIHHLHETWDLSSG